MCRSAAPEGKCNPDFPFGKNASLSGLPKNGRILSPAGLLGLTHEQFLGVLDQVSPILGLLRYGGLERYEWLDLDAALLT
jgi:hypothetical protein